MEHNKDNKPTRKGKYLSRDERISIEAFLKTCVSTQWIADQLGRSKSTITREIKRGLVEQLNSDLSTTRRYRADRGQDVQDKNATAKGSRVKLMSNSVEVIFIRDHIVLKGWSPEVISAEMIKNKMENVVCFKTIYNHIDKGEIPGVSNESLLEKSTRSKGGLSHGRVRKRAVPIGRSIKDRPEKVLDRSEVGDWEIDLVVSGKNQGKAALLTLTERKSRKEFIRKLPDGTQNSVIQAMNGIELSMGSNLFQKTFRSMTSDNGSEFLDFKSLEKSVSLEEQRTWIYYADPYASWQRGSNENANRIIRRFIPKGSDISTFTDEDIQRIEDWMNHYPRKILNFKTPEEMFIQEMAA